MLPWRWNPHYPWMSPLLPRHPCPLPAGWAPSPGRSSGSLAGWLDPDTHHSSLCLLEQGHILWAVDCEIICEVLWPFAITLKSLSSGPNAVGLEEALLGAPHLLLHCSTISLAQILWPKFQLKREHGEGSSSQDTSAVLCIYLLNSGLQLWEEEGMQMGGLSFTWKCKTIDFNIFMFKQRPIFWLFESEEILKVPCSSPTSHRSSSLRHTAGRVTELQEHLNSHQLQSLPTHGTKQTTPNPPPLFQTWRCLWGPLFSVRSDSFQIAWKSLCCCKC